MTKDETLKLALDALEGFIPYLPLKNEAQCNRYDKAITAIKEALETKDEPVAWGMETDGLIYDVICPDEHEREEGEYTIPLYTKPQLETKDEPVAWEQFHEHMAGPNYVAPRRTWVWLTDKEVDECLQGLPTQTIDVYARRIETKIKEKNT